MAEFSSQIRVLHVDDEPDFARMAAEFIEREGDEITVEAATGAEAGLDQLSSAEFDCVVSDYDMPGTDGIQFLRQVREEFGELPFILFTGKGSEEVASDAISAGVTDYLQKTAGTDQYSLLVNRIRNATERVRATEAVEETQEWARKLLEHSTDYVLVVDGNGTISYVSPSVERVMGYEPDGLVGTSAFEFAHPEDLDRATESFAETLENPDEEATVEFRARDVDGDYRWLAVRGRNLLRDPVIGGVLVNIRDITARRERQEELELMEQAIDAAPVGMTISDPSQDDNPIVYANRGFEQLTGYDADEVLGRNCRFLQGPETAAEPVAELREAIDEARPVSVELRNYRADGSAFWNKVTVAPIRDDDGTVTNFVGFQEDVSARKEREGQLRREQSRVELALRATNSYIFEIDLETGREERFGDWETLHNVEMEEVPSTEAFIEHAVHPEDQGKVWEAHEDFEPTPGASVRFDYRTHPDHGDVRWIRAQMEVQSTAPGEARKGIGLATDVTEIQREQTRIEALFENSVDPIAFTEFVDGEPIVRQVNQAFEETFGCDAADAEGRSLDAIVVPDDPAKAEEADDLNRRIESGERVVTEVRRRTPEGVREFLLQSTPLDPGESGRLTYAVYSDITGQKAYERALRGLHEASERLLKAGSRRAACEVVIELATEVLEHPYSSVFLWDEDAEVLRPEAASDPSLAAFGDPPTFARGQGLVGHVYETGERVVLDDAQEDPRALESGSQGIHGYCLIPLAEFGVLMMGSPDVGAFSEQDVVLAGNLAAHATVALDRIDREQALLQRERRLQRQNERLDEFASVVSHDLRNPLSVATGRLELAMEEFESEDLEATARALDRIDSLIDRMLSLARAGETVGEPEAVELAAIAQESWQNVPTGSARLDVELAARVQADASRLRQLFENLFRNSIDHGGSAVTVRVGELSGGFYVEDDGDGLPSGVDDDLFEPGTTTAEEGTGFGLSIVREIVEAHGWEIAATDGEAGGARFEITGVEPAG